MNYECDDGWVIGQTVYGIVCTAVSMTHTQYIYIYVYIYIHKHIYKSKYMDLQYIHISKTRQEYRYLSTHRQRGNTKPAPSSAQAPPRDDIFQPAWDK